MKPVSGTTPFWDQYPTMVGAFMHVSQAKALKEAARTG